MHLLPKKFLYSLVKYGHLHMIKGTEDDSKQHLDNTQDDSLLHFVGVHEDQLVLCYIP